MLDAMWGPSLWMHLLFILCVCIVACVFISTLFTVLYQRLLYEQVIRPRFDATFHPKCSVFVPCKGTTKDFEINLRAFSKLDYDSYEVIYSVESSDDPAVATINAVIRDCPHTSMVVAGLTNGCAQKNWNQIAAVKKADNPDVYVFADADISPRADWLRELVLPLSIPSIAVTTGFRWLHAERATLGQQTHFYMNSFLYTLYCFSSFFGSVGLWGGSMAIRKRDFDDIGVAARWAETVVDDSSLSQLVKKNKMKSMLVPTCITHTDDLITSVHGATRWFERQMMFLKAYQKGLWCAAIPLISLALVTLLWLPVAGIVALSTKYSFFAIGGGSALVLWLGKLASDMLYPFLGTMPRLGAFIVYQPIALLAFLYSCFRTAFTNTVTWSGYKYKLSFRTGKVTGVERIV
jgi:cellulose synthase/poly-beta-1,6-N-acetylglucosamine synthase-like glycosyltransferase